MATTRELWQRWVARQDEAAFEALLRPELPAAYDLARRMGFPRADAEDAVQDALLELAKTRGPKPGEIGVGAWLIRAVRFRVLSNARSARRRRQRELHRGAPPPRDGDAALEVHEEVERALDTLEEGDRQILVLRFLYDLDYREIAYVLGASENACRIRVHRASERMRARLGWKAPALLAALVLPSYPRAAESIAAATTPTAPATPAGGLAEGATVSTSAKAAIGLSAVAAVLVTAAFLALLLDPPPPVPDPGAWIAVRPGASEKPMAPGVTGSGETAMPAVPEKPGFRRAVVRDFENPQTPPGMVFVPPGTAVIGTTRERLNELLTGRPKAVRKNFAYEVPQHTVEVQGFFADRHEVTNAQYLLFLQHTAKVSYDTGKSTLANLEEVAGSLMHVPKEHGKDDDKAWRQLYRGNKAKLHEKMPRYIEKDPAGEIDERKTEDAFHYAPLVPGMELEFYDRKPPETWPDLEPPRGFLDHPVTSISYDDAEAYAEWAGKHVLTEIEWAYVARGPEGFFFPWGDEWFPDASRANWDGKFTGQDLPKEIQTLLEEGKKYEAVTMPVASVPAGRSWCGVHHMLGNAAEWTSSWFGPYPGNERDHAYMGEFCKVIRGATHVDQDPLALRAAARNFVGAGTKAPPRPGNRFEYVGFRCGWYGQPGKDQLGPMIRRVSRGRRVTSKNTAGGQYVGAVATAFAKSEDEVENHVYVKDKAHAVVFVPVTTILHESQEDEVRKRESFMRMTVEGKDPVPLGVLHVDLPLEPVWVQAPAARDAPRPTQPELPEVEEGTCPPGTYVLAIWWNRPCLCTERLEFRCFLSRGPMESVAFDVRKLKPERVPRPELEVQADVDILFLSFAVPIGGKENDEDVYAWMKTLTLTTVEGELAKTGTWR